MNPNVPQPPWASEPEPTVPLDPAPYQGYPPAPYQGYPPGPYQGYPPGLDQGYPPNPYDPRGTAASGYPVDPRQPTYPAVFYPAQKSRVAAGVLGILLGTLGVHNFYLGRTGVAVLQLLLSVLSLGILAPLVGIWALVEGILILVGSPSFATDRRGIPLRD